MFSSGGPSVRFLTRYDGEVSEPLVGRQGAPREGERWRGRRGASGPARPGYLGALEGPAAELWPGRA